jgi:hypothetical protein
MKHNFNKKRRTPQEEFEHTVVGWTMQALLMGVVGWAVSYALVRLVGTVLSQLN